MMKIEQEIQDWLNRVVTGLNLCPFAARPLSKGQVRIQVSGAHSEEALLSDLEAEIRLLEHTAPQRLETTLLVVPNLLASFDHYNRFLDIADALLQAGGWEGVFQVASFHPQYQFADTASEDAENLTNRAPYPILHILREASVERALENYPEPDQIPVRNILRMRALSAEDKRDLFPFLAGES